MSNFDTTNKSAFSVSFHNWNNLAQNVIPNQNCTKITYLLRPSLQLNFAVTQKYIQMIYLFLYCRALISTLLLRTSVHLSENNISYGSYTHNTQPSKFKQPPSPLLGPGFLTVSQSFLDQFSKSLSKTPFFSMVGCTTKPVSNQWRYRFPSEKKALGVLGRLTSSLVLVVLWRFSAGGRVLDALDVLDKIREQFEAKSSYSFSKIAGKSLLSIS